jgi:hypothetical protein
MPAQHNVSCRVSGFELLDHENIVVDFHNLNFLGKRKNRIKPGVLAREISVTLGNLRRAQRIIGGSGQHGDRRGRTGRRSPQLPRKLRYRQRRVNGASTATLAAIAPPLTRRSYIRCSCLVGVALGRTRLDAGPPCRLPAQHFHSANTPFSAFVCVVSTHRTCQRSGCRPGAGSPYQAARPTRSSVRCGTSFTSRPISAHSGFGAC